jgi:hypothetical protein
MRSESLASYFPRSHALRGRGISFLSTSLQSLFPAKFRQVTPERQPIIDPGPFFVGNTYSAFGPQAEGEYEHGTVARIQGENTAGAWGNPGNPGSGRMRWAAAGCSGARLGS